MCNARLVLCGRGIYENFHESTFGLQDSYEQQWSAIQVNDMIPDKLIRDDMLDNVSTLNIIKRISAPSL